MAVANRIHFRTLKSGLAIAGLLFFLGAPAEASCLDLLRAKPVEVSQQLYEQSLNSDRNEDPKNLWPEELLALLSKDSSPQLLPFLKSQLGFEALRFSSRFDFHRWPYKILELERPKDTSSNGLAEYQLKLLRFVFETKRRSLRFSLNPKSYLLQMLVLSAELDKFARPLQAMLSPESAARKEKRMVPLRLLLGSLLLLRPSPQVLWPTDDQHLSADDTDRKKIISRRMAAHWGLTRSLIGLYMLSFASSLTELPQALESVEILYKMRGDLVELGEDLAKGQPYDRKAERLRLIEHYEQRIRNLEEKLQSNDKVDRDRIQLQIKDMIAAIDSMKSELEKMP